MNLGSMLTDTVTYKQRTGVSTAGDPTYGSALTASARVEHGRKIVQVDGEQVVFEHWFTTETELKPEWRCWLPGDDTTKDEESRRVVHVRKAATPDGLTTLFEVYL